MSALRVFDLQGRELPGVAHVTTDGPGAYRVHIDLRGAPAGVYVCQAATATGTLSRKILNLN